MAAKCTITESVLEKLSNLYWGFSCKDSSLEIIENYIEYLDCANVKQQICKDDSNCKQETIIFNCNFNVLQSHLSVNEDILNFSFQVGDIIGGKQPFSYQWTFDTNDFVASSPTNQSTLILTLKPWKRLDVLVSQITMQVTDADGCIDTKTCALVNGVLNCNVNYVACPNPNDLIVTNMFTQCAGPIGLLVSKI